MFRSALMLVLVPWSLLNAQKATIDQTISAKRYKFDGVTQIVVSPNGTVAVGSGRSDAIYFFDSNGEPRASTPVAHVTFNTMGPIGDSLWAYDAKSSTVAIYRWDGRKVGDREAGFTISMPNGDPSPLARPGGMLGPIVMGLASGGDLIMSALLHDGGVLPEPWGRPKHSGTPQVRVTRDGVMKTLVGWQWNPDCTAGKGAGNRTYPFCGISYGNYSSDASFFAIAVPYLSGPDSARIVVTATRNNGDTLFSRKVPFKPEPIPQRTLDSALNATMRISVALSDEAEKLLMNYHPAGYQPVTSVAVADDGSVWLRGRPVEGESRTDWLVVPPDGMPTRKVSIPTEVRRLLVIRGKQAWGTTTSVDSDPDVVRLALP